MKNFTIPTLGTMLLAGSLTAAAKPKTTTPVKIDPKLINEKPYRYNGAVLTETARGSGFCAWNRRAFFTAGHVVMGEETWEAPPTWYPAQNAENLNAKKAIPSRGYFRWTEYAELAGGSDVRFSKDVALAFAFEKLITGLPATVNLKGDQDLRKNAKSMITGYPAENAYLDEDISGYFLHRTGPVVSPYQKSAGKALITTKVTTGGGNSGGPVWTQDKNKAWVASGVLTGGLPSETVVYSFSSDVNSLTRALAPVLKKEMGKPIVANGVTGSSLFFPLNKETVIPDGSKKWTSFRIGVDKFETGALLTKVKLSLDISTKDRGDLLVILEGPGGYSAVIHNEQGGGKPNLIVDGKDLTEAFVEIEANGYWYLRVQDRIKGDKATFKSAVLEVSTDEVADSTTPTP